MHAMRNTFVALLAVGLCATFAMADASAEQNFYDTRDAGILGHSTENLSNQGAATRVRCAKARQYFLLMDFDFEEIAAFVAANIEPGYTAKYELRLTASSDDLNGVSIALVACEMDAAGMDWVEGDGVADYANLNWTPGTMAATYVDPDMETDMTPGPSQWMWSNQFDAHRNDLTVRNANLMTFGLVGEAWVELTQDFIALQATNPVARGFYTYDVDSAYSNGSVYTDDQHTGVQPMIKVSFVPEPASMSLLALGGVAALIRRKK